MIRTVKGALAVIVLLLGLLALMVVPKVLLLQSPNYFTAKVVPVDPRSLMSGDYVILSYEFSEVKVSDWPRNKRRGQYAKIEKIDESWQVSRFSQEPQPSDPGHWYLEIEHAHQNSTPQDVYINLTFGIESFYLPEGSGKEVEKMIASGDTLAEIAVNDQGQSLIRALILPNGKRIEVGLWK